MTMYLEQTFIGSEQERRHIQIAHYESVSEMINHVDEQHESGRWELYDEEKRNTRFTNGSSLKTLDRARHCVLYAEPPAHVLQKAELFRQQLMGSDAYRLASERARSTRRQRVFQLEGGELDIDRHLGGQDECWSRVTRGLQRPVVRLGMRVNTSGGNDESAYAGLAALTECCGLLAEQAGCSLEILGVLVNYHAKHSTSEYPHDTHESGAVFLLKQAHEPLNAPQILACGIPTLQRWYRFNITHNLLGGRTDSGQGTSLALKPEIREHLQLQHVLEVAWNENQQRMFLDDFVKTLHEV